MEQYVECINDIHDGSGFSLNYVYKGRIYLLLHDGAFGYKVSVPSAKHGEWDYDKKYFRLLSEVEVLEMKIKKEIYG